MTEEEVLGFDALFDSMMKCKSGVIWKDSVARYYLNGLEETLKLEEQLKNGTYKPRKPTKIKVTYPKERDVVSIAFRDRVYQRSLNDNEIYPKMSKSLIYDNMACQKGKGTERAIKRIKTFLSKMYRKYGTDFYVLQMVIKGYYPNMRHDVAKRKFRKHLKDWSYERATKIMDEQYDGKVGYNPGSQMIQIAGISVLDELDHYIKEQLKTNCYIRYQDDMILIHQDKEYLEQCFMKITQELSKLGFEINKKKTAIYPISEGIKALGFTFHLNDTGKIYMLIDSENVKHQRKKLRRLVHKAKKGLITREQIDASLDGWKAHAKLGNTYNVRKRMDEYYNELWKEEV